MLSPFSRGLAIAASVLCFVVGARAQEVVPSAEEIKKAFIGRTVWANFPIGRFTMSHSASGECQGIRGMGGGTETFRGRCEIGDGKICYQIPQITPFCLNILRDGSRFYYVTRAGHRVYFEF